MTEKTRQLIAQFSPKPINIPVNKCELEEVIDTLINLMFPICNCPEGMYVQEGLTIAAEKLHANITTLHNPQAADEKTEAFFTLYPTLQERLYKDAACYLQYDPAAKSLEEVVITYPGSMPSVRTASHMRSINWDCRSSPVSSPNMHMPGWASTSTPPPASARTVSWITAPALLLVRLPRSVTM